MIVYLAAADLRDDRLRLQQAVRGRAGRQVSRLHARLVRARCSTYKELNEALKTSIKIAIVASMHRDRDRGAARAGARAVPLQAVGASRTTWSSSRSPPRDRAGTSLLTMFVNAYTSCRIGFGSILICHIVFSIAFVAVTVRARVQGLDRSLENAAQDLGADAVPDLRAGHAAADHAGHRGGVPAGVRALARRLRDHELRGRAR